MVPKRRAESAVPRPLALLATGALLLILPALLLRSGHAGLASGVALAGFGLLCGLALLSARDRLPVQPTVRQYHRVIGRESAGSASGDHATLADPTPEWDPMAPQETVTGAAFQAPQRPFQLDRALLEAMAWRRFGEVVEQVFALGGFLTRADPHTATPIVDVWLAAPRNPEQTVGLVRCLHGRFQVHQEREVRWLHERMISAGVTHGYLASTGEFTPGATDYALRHRISLLNSASLLALMTRRSASDRASLLAVALEGEFWRPTCPACTAKLLPQTPADGSVPYWGCGCPAGRLTRIPVRPQPSRPRSAAFS